MQIGSWICLALMVSVRVLGYLITMSRKEAWWWWWWTCTRQNLFLSTTSFGCSSVSINMSFNTDVCCKRSLSYKGRRRWGIHPRAPRQSCRLCSQYLQWLHNFLNRKLQPDSTVLRIRALYFMKRKPCSTMAQSRSKRTRTDWWEFLLAVVNHQMSDWLIFQFCCSKIWWCCVRTSQNCC